MIAARLPPVLCYHRIGGPRELGVTRVAESVFGRQMRALAREGWQTLTLGEYADLVSGRSAPRVPPAAFLLTFDDGYASLADAAYPILADLGFTAVTFLVTDFVGRENTWDVRYTWKRLRHLGWDDIERWRGRGFEFGSHGATHRRLTWLDDAVIRQELGRSRETLVRRLGPDAGRAVAYPFGAADARVGHLAQAAGFDLGFGGVRASQGALEGDRLHVSRVPVYSWDVGDVPFGLRDDGLGGLGRLVAHVANRCAVGTTIMKSVMRLPLSAFRKGAHA